MIEVLFYEAESELVRVATFEILIQEIPGLSLDRNTSHTK
jgi:hypothetical protein